MERQTYQTKRIVIVGSGFAGVRCALRLSQTVGNRAKITLVSNTSHFEYHATLYRVASGCSPYEVCIPLSEIFKDRDIEVVKDYILDVDSQNQVVHGKSGSSYHYDYLVLGLGSDTAYFNLAGVKENSYSFKNLNDALRLKKHLHETFKSCVVEDSNENKKCSAHIVIIGGGASGVELAGQMVDFCSKLSKELNIDPAFLRIDLIEASDRILKNLSAEASEIAHKRLEFLGVNVILNKSILKEDFETVYLKDLEIKSKTVIWTAGISANPLIKNIVGLVFNQRGQVEVNDSMNPTGFSNVFVLGDCASTKYSGWAQTALYDGSFAAGRISDQLSFTKFNEKYQPFEPMNYIPIGDKWALADYNGFVVSGFFGWLLRRFADLTVYLALLPFDKAFSAFFSSWVDKDSCTTCKEVE